MTKLEAKALLDQALKEYNEEMEGYIINCDEPERANLRKLTAVTMDCLADFEKVIIRLAE